jgi:16S rRNA processing protein RimM
VRFKGVDDRNAAEALRLVQLYVAREQLGDVEEDEFFHADLIGLAAVQPDGSALGTVIAVQNFGAGDLLEIAPAQGGASVLLPFIKAVVPAIDVAAGIIIVDPPPGLIEETPATHTAPPSPLPLAGEGARRR